MINNTTNRSIHICYATDMIEVRITLTITDIIILLKNSPDVSVTLQKINFWSVGC